MPPSRKATPQARSVITRNSKASADSLKAAEEAATKRLRQEEPPSDDSDIEISLEEAVSQAEQEVTSPDAVPDVSFSFDFSEQH